MAQKPSVPKGTRDFSPQEVAKRNYIKTCIETQFQRFGFLPIETPSFENSSTLMGKYGEEGDRLIFKILNSGDYLIKADADAFEQKDSAQLTASISEKALRYDLTVPFARYVVQHQNEIDFPFKRYQIQPVWRADRPQKGRYREFYQCDADVIGSTSIWQDVEFVQLYDAVFTDLNIQGAVVKVNHRKILAGFAELIGAEDKLIDFTVALDKLDKIGKEAVVAEMQQKGIEKQAIEKVSPIFELSGSNLEQLEQLRTLLASSAQGLEGIADLEFILKQTETLGTQTVALSIDCTLARGLNYYTGTIFEVAAPAEINLGSIGGGGRYDDLTGIFGLKGMSGVGISFGLDRIYLVMEQLGIFPETVQARTQILFLNFGQDEAAYCLQCIKTLRQQGVSAELYPDNAKMKKQMGYADKRNIPYVVLVGSKEVESNRYTLKNMKTGTQQTYSLPKLMEWVKTIKNK